ncbi:MAG: transposase [Desulfuromonadales bacterium]|nr:transposase [Desulfuromonadales bacterium]
MPRQARIDIPGLLQHVIVRGIERRKIFLDDEDRENFIARLTHVLEATQTICYAWAMLDNHVHLLLMPTIQPLSRFMRKLLTGYAVSFNHRHKRSGYLFQNRYKSIVCDGDAYLMELVRYIHLNPVRAKMVPDMQALTSYRWCGHRQLMGLGKEQLITEEDILSLFDRRKNAARKAYLQFINDGLQQKWDKLSRGGRKASQAFDDTLTDQDLYDDRILGGGDFVERILEKTQLPEGSKTLDDITALVTKHYNVDPNELYFPNKARTIASAKAVICYLATRRYRFSGTSVAKRLGITRSAVSRAAQRGQHLFEADDVLREI